METLKDWSESIWDGVFEITKEDVGWDTEEGGGVEDGDWLGGTDGVGEDEGIEVAKINDQVALQSLHVPDISFAFILQNQVPGFRVGV